jgi:hypothetical protein
MITEDITNGIVPYRHQAKQNQIFVMEGQQDEVEESEQLCASLGRYDYGASEEIICEAIKSVAHRLSYNGKAIFELLRDTKGEPVILHSFNVNFLYSIPRYYVQLPPRSCWPYIDGKKYAVINKSEVWYVEMPSELGGARGHQRMLRALSVWGNLGPKFFAEDLENQRFSSDFVFMDYVRENRAYQYGVTRRWGWNRRDGSLDHKTEYYYFHRLITFRWAQAVLREHVIKEFNALLRRLGRSARIAQREVSSAQDILSVRERLEQGSIDFDGVNKALELWG